MPINPLVLELLEEITESGRSAEDVCKDRPELLGEVRACLRQLSSVRDELDALFPDDDEASSSPSIRPQARPEIPGYNVGDILGRGGMGVVYKARHLRLNRPVAVKMMLNGGFAGPAELARFHREAEALAALQHPNIVQVHDVGESGGLPYFTMEFVDGGNLAQKLGGVPQPARGAAGLMVLLASAVEAAHRGGIVHRDLKPANILLTADGTPKITDFGLARRFEQGAGLSMTGVRIGTPGYMAPEQVDGHARVSGAATDVYALGAILYEMLTGRPPFLAETAVETERQVVAEEPAAPSRLNAQVPRDLETICLKCLQKEPKRRYSSAAELGDDLGRFLSGEPIKARPVCSIERAGKWMRRHPTRTVTLFGGMTIAVAMLVGGWWLSSARSLVTHAVEEDLRVATQALRRSAWDEARSALDRARTRLGPVGPDELSRRLEQAGRDQELVEQLAAIRIDRISRVEGGSAHWAAEYEKIFRKARLLDMDEEPRVAAVRLRASDVKDALVAAIDDWALCAFYIADARSEAWLLDVARRSDDQNADGWRNDFRDPSVRRDKEELARLVASAKILETPVNQLVSLGELLQRLGGDAIPFLLSVQQQHPNDIWVNSLLGHYAMTRGDTPETLRNYQAALAIRPDTPSFYRSLGLALTRISKFTEADSYYRKAVELTPKDELLRISYGDCLVQDGRFAEAAEQYERGLEFTQLASIRLLLRRKLLRCHLRSGDVKKADELWRSALMMTPPNQEDWDEYAEFCLYHGRQEEYHATCRGLIEHFGATEDARVAERIGRACLLAPASGDLLREATALIDRALADKQPKQDWVQYFFMVAKGLAEYRHGRFESAIKIMDGPASPALQPAPRLVSAMARHQLGRKEEALKTFSVAILANDWRKSRADEREEWIYHILRREAEELMLPNLRAFLDGAYQPRSQDEKTCFLGPCQYEGRYRAAAEIYVEVLASDSQLSDDLFGGMRYRAACTAAAAGSGRGHDAAGLDGAGRLRWRKQARDWLRADLDVARKLAKSRSGELNGFLKLTLKNWSTDPDLAALRDRDACKGLLPSEQKEFLALCEEFRILTNEPKN
jgi:eukaryotic-like serine/threonine-protein kinase